MLGLFLKLINLLIKCKEVVGLRLLLTNDDGISAPGIQQLSLALSEIAEVTVVAPMQEQSGASQAITVHQPIIVDDYLMPKVKVAWRIGGTPADCVKLALEKLMDHKPDFVVSGINSGANLGMDVVYSGTVSAAREGAMHHIPAIAVSLDNSKATDYMAVATFIKQLLPKLNKNILPDNLLLNINAPANWQYGDKFAYTKLGIRNYENTFEKRLNPSGRSYYWMGGTVAKMDNSPDTDVAAVESGILSITPIHFDLTDRQLLQQLLQQN